MHTLVIPLVSCCSVLTLQCSPSGSWYGITVCRYCQSKKKNGSEEGVIASVRIWLMFKLIEGGALLFKRQRTLNFNSNPNFHMKIFCLIESDSTSQLTQLSINEQNSV